MYTHFENELINELWILFNFGLIYYCTTHHTYHMYNKYQINNHQNPHKQASAPRVYSQCKFKLCLYMNDLMQTGALQ